MKIEFKEDLPIPPNCRQLEELEEGDIFKMVGGSGDYTYMHMGENGDEEASCWKFVAEGKGKIVTLHLHCRVKEPKSVRLIIKW